MQLNSLEDFLSYVAREYNSDAKIYGLDKSQFR